MKKINEKPGLNIKNIKHRGILCLPCGYSLWFNNFSACPVGVLCVLCG